MPLTYDSNTLSSQDITGSGLVLVTHSMVADGRVGLSIYLSGLHINAAAITVLLEPLDYADFSFGPITVVTTKVTGDTRLRIEVDETVFVPVGSKVRVMLKSSGTVNTSVNVAWYLFDPNHASDVSALAGESLDGHVGENFNTFFEDGGSTSSRVIGEVPTSAEIADAVWDETFTDHTSTPNTTAEALARNRSHPGQQ